LSVVLGTVLIVVALTACDSKSEQTPSHVERSGAASAASPSGPPGPEEIVGQGDFIDAGVLADGSVMTLWCSTDDSDECDAFAFRITARDGATAYGRLPGYADYAVAAAGHRFLVEMGNQPRQAYLLVDRRGRMEKVGRSSTERPIAPGDVLIPPRHTNDEWATIVRPADGTAFKVTTPGTVRLYLATDGTLWGESAGHGDVQVRWRRDGSSFMSFTYDRVADYESTYGPQPGELVASGPHAAVFSCGDVASGQGCGNKLAVTSDSGRSWIVRDGSSLPFKIMGNQAGSLAVAGTTLIVAELRFGGSGPRTVLWRSADRTWTTFEKLASLPGIYAELKASRAAVWTYGVPSDYDPDRDLGPLLSIDLTGTVHQVTS
jgi:hypothetical protein